MYPAPTVRADVVPDTAELTRYATRLLQLRQWPEARSALHELALRQPTDRAVRARLALARGHEAEDHGDPQRAGDEWRWALQLDPTLHDAAVALRSLRARRPSWWQRLRPRL